MSAGPAIETDAEAKLLVLKAKTPDTVEETEVDNIEKPEAAKEKKVDNEGL